jgi:ribose transport system permease protein
MHDMTKAETGKVSERKPAVLKSVLKKWGTFASFIGMVIYFSVATPYYFTAINFSNIVYEAVIPICLSLGLTIVIMVGSFDLSIGAIASFCGMVTALLFPILGSLPACFLGLVGAGLFGLINGVMVGVFGISGIIATVAMQAILTGIEIVISHGIEIPIPLSFHYFLAFGQGSIGQIKILISGLLFVTIVAHFFITKTALGTNILAVGINPMASIYSGIKIKLVVIQAFFLSAIFSGLGGIMLIAMNTSYKPAAAGMYLLDAFCIVFLGSTILKEGKPYILGTFIAGIMLSYLTTGLMLSGVRYEWQIFIKGAVLIMAVAFSVFLRERKEIRTEFL